MATQGDDGHGDPRQRDRAPSRRNLREGEVSPEALRRDDEIDPATL